MVLSFHEYLFCFNGKQNNYNIISYQSHREGSEPEMGGGGGVCRGGGEAGCIVASPNIYIIHLTI